MKSMNNIYKVLIGVAVGLLVGSLIGWSLTGTTADNGDSYGGVTNYDSLQLQPSSSSDDALDVRDSGGTSRFVVDGSGAITVSGAFTATGESRINRVRDTGSVFTVATSSVATITAAQFCDNGIIIFPDWTGAASSTAVLNLPTAEDVFSDCLTTDGDEYTLWIYSEVSAAASTTLITVGSASTTLTGVDTSADVLNGGNKLIVTVSRASSTQMTVDLVEKVDAD